MLTWGCCERCVSVCVSVCLCMHVHKCVFSQSFNYRVTKDVRCTVKILSALLLLILSEVSHFICSFLMPKMEGSCLCTEIPF